MAQRPVYISSSVINVNTTSATKVIILPVVSSIQGNSIIIRDATGTANTNFIYVSTQGLDRFDNGRSTIIMSNTYQAVKVVAYSNTNWAILQNYTQGYLVKNPQWIAVGQGPDSVSSILYSYDSLNWTKGTPTPFNGPIQTITNNGSNLWVLGGDDPSNKKLKYSSDGITWSSDTDIIDFTYGADGVIYDSNANKWFAVGTTLNSTGTILYSTDPSQGWTTINTGGFTKNIGTGITKGANIYVATGGSHERTGSIQNSTDGSNWFNSVSGGFSTSGVYQGNAVATNGSQWIATGRAAISTGSILNSSDGLNWTNAVSGGFPAINPVIKWVATGNGDGVIPTSTMKYSLDGLNWSNIVSGGFQSQAIGIAFGGSNIWVAGGVSQISPQGTIQYSGNGSNWSNVNSGGFSLGYDIDGNFKGGQGMGFAFGNNIWVATGLGNVTILYSLDGKNWNDAQTGYFPDIGYNIAYNNTTNLWVAAGENIAAVATLLYSGDGINWSNADSGGFDNGGGFYNGNGVLASDNLWIATGRGSTRETSILTSTDGKNWIPVTTGGFDDGAQFVGKAVAYNGLNLYVAAGNSSNARGTLQYSGNGTNWSNANSGGFDTGYANDIAYNGSLWIATGTGVLGTTILYSGDGSNWSNVTSGSFLDLTVGVAYNPLGPTAEGTSVAWANDKWIATGVGTGSTTSVLYSGDGSNWSNIPTGGFSNSVGYGISNINRRSFALGSSSASTNTIITSSDGITWSNVTSGGFNGFPGSAISYKRWTSSSN